ncbi:hypothetical protein [Undibacterium flavidum]|uniref:Zinc ribbon family protein n=1 Tax=Undibacterium flavidum TaxID=2762297 RepID=A0ABR6YHI4_9BURK|nr:hypothetical protein [Undibacterium flavidum]MBC3875972.1 hypothetical protein [Undibacterium flavidum]
MLVLFGWVKEAKEIASALSCHCYRCQRKRAWEHWKETEWVSFFMIKTIPFLSKSYVVCSACRESVLLNREQVALLEVEAKLPRLAAFLEEHQLSQKTEVQRNFLLAQREQNQSRE